MKEGRTCILHIGPPKTGTSSLQHSLAGYNDGETIYAFFGGGIDSINHSYALVVGAAGQERTDDYLSGRDDSGLTPSSRELELKIAYQYKCLTNKMPDANLCRSQILDLVANQKFKNVIFSGEGLFSNFGCAKHVYALLSPYFQNFEVICYLRPIFGSLLSEVQQKLKIPAPQLFWNAGVIEKFGSGRILDIRNSVSDWIDVFGRDNVSAIPMATGTLQGGDVVKDFINRFELDRDQISQVRINESLSAESIGILALLYKKGKLKFTNKNFMTNKARLGVLLSYFGDGKAIVGPALQFEITSKCKSEINWLNELCSFNLLEGSGTDGVRINCFDDLVRLGVKTLPKFAVHLNENWMVDLSSTADQPMKFIRQLIEVLCRPPSEIQSALPPGFDPQRYIQLNPDLEKAKVNPEKHFRVHGQLENRPF